MTRPDAAAGSDTAVSGDRLLTRVPPHGWLGLLLIGLAWPLNWILPGPRTHLLFFPLWLGYILTADALVFVRTRRSPLDANPLRLAGLFAASVPLWWIFELINTRTRNWTYVGADLFSDLEYALLASVAFSTVIPAVLVTAELVYSFSWIHRLRHGWVLPGRAVFASVLFAAGWVMLALVLAYPDAFYPLVWGALYAIVEPLNVWRGRRSLLARLHEGDWRPLVALSLGALTCGFFWEMWNYFAFPRWIYRTPGVGAPYLFEMPLLGYLGYLPFAWEVYAFVHLITRRLPALAFDGSDTDPKGRSMLV